MFETLSDRLESVFSSIRDRGRLSQSDIDATCREIRVALLEADVALPVVKDFIAAVKERARGAEVSRALNPSQQIIKIVNDELVRILGSEARRLRFAKTPPTVIMLAGLQGSGKTTVAAKLARWLQEQGHTPLLAAADLQRPNAVDQLQALGERAGVAVHAPEPGTRTGADNAADGRGQAGGDPVTVAQQSVDQARRAHHDIVVVDTAGRLGIDAEMMQQAADIRDAVEPNETLFVVDAMIGQDAVSTAQAFLEGVGLDGVVLTKLDGDARGGAALSVAQVTGQQVMFASSGEKLSEFDVFHPERMASRVLGMGDVLTLIEQAEKAFDADQAARMTDKMVEGDSFTLDDFLEQMVSIRKMGTIGNLLGMLPGTAQMREQLSEVDDRDVDRITAIIRSMTPEERRKPKIINGSRRARIARGSGVTVAEVNGLVHRFFDAQKMMKQFASDGLSGQAGTPGSSGKATKASRAKAKKKGKPKKAKSGHPASKSTESKGDSSGGSQGPAGANAPGRLPPGVRMPDLSKLNLPSDRE